MSELHLFESLWLLFLEKNGWFFLQSSQIDLFHVSDGNGMGSQHGDALQVHPLLLSAGKWVVVGDGSQLSNLLKHAVLRVPKTKVHSAKGEGY